MKKSIAAGVLLVAVMFTAVVVVAQILGTVKGSAKDQAGKPIAGATVELVNPDTGKKFTGKTNNRGEYVVVGVLLGTYQASLIVDGQLVDKINGVPVAAGEDRTVNFDLAQDLKGGGLTEEQKKKQESAQKESQKIKGLNAALAQARDLEKAGNYDQAITVLQQATQSDPSKDLLWAYLGDAQRGAKKYPDAIESYQKALAINPAAGSYHNGLGDAYAKSGQTEKAVQEYTAAAQADPANAGTYYFNEGAVFTNTGKVDEAIAAFDKAIQIDPNRADAYYWKGVNLMGKATLKGDKMIAPEGTAEAFNKYLELAPTGANADAAKQMLASIGASVETSYGKAKSSGGTKKKP